MSSTAQGVQGREAVDPQSSGVLMETAHCVVSLPLVRQLKQELRESESLLYAIWRESAKIGIRIYCVMKSPTNRLPQ